jgi:hypothetical protein
VALKTAIGRTLLLLCALALAEGVLRLQQSLGPLYDLDLRDQDFAKQSNDLNHRPAPSETWTLGRREVFGEQAGLRYTVRHDPDGIRIGDGCAPTDNGRAAVRILFLGDSFVEGYADSTTLVRRVCEALESGAPGGPPVALFNAGCASYSPALYVPQAKRLVPRLTPDLVVVVFDETDLYDDFVRYRNLIERDPQGRIVRVRPTPPATEMITGLQATRAHSLYLQRLVHKLYHTRVYMPIFRAGYVSWSPYGVLEFDRDHDPLAARKYAEQIAFLSADIRELAVTLAALLPGSDRVLFVCHPYLQHLVPEADGFVWHRLVADAVARIANETGVGFYDAASDLRLAAGGDPASLYWRNDMHFNFRGTRVYGRLLSDRLTPLIAQAWHERAAAAPATAAR